MGGGGCGGVWGGVGGCGGVLGGCGVGGCGGDSPKTSEELNNAWLKKLNSLSEGKVVGRTYFGCEGCV